jgi:subtilisin family serine protease
MGVMASLRVIASVANLRLAPVEDLKNKGNVIGKLVNGAPFESVNETTNKLGPWFQDVNGHWVWGGGLGIVTAAPSAPTLKPEVTIAVKIENSLLTRLQIDQIWNAGETGDKAVVAILDSGIALNCSDLTDAVALNDTSRMKNFVAGSNTMDDDKGHGSHCAGILASRNNLHAVGIAKGCKLYVGKITDSHNSPSVTNMIKGLRWAGGLEIDSPNDVDIISMSNGSLLNTPDMQPTIAEILAKGKIVVCSIGNRGPQSLPSGGTFPAMINGVISVGAVDLDNAFQDFSYEFNNLTISCPGVNIFSYWINGDTHIETGTSQSTAVCAGIIALLVSKLKRVGESNIQSKIFNLLLNSNFKVNNDGFQYRFIEPIKLFNSI